MASASHAFVASACFTAEIYRRHGDSASGFQVIDNTVKWMARVAGQQVFRARFSAISAPEITAAMVLSPPFMLPHLFLTTVL